MRTTPYVPGFNPGLADGSGILVGGALPGLDLSEWTDDRATPEWRAVAPRGFGDDRSGIIQAQVVVDEDHEDDLQITEHPVQGGVVVHDHAFKRPAVIRCRMGWSNAYAYDNNIENVRSIYQDILQLQARRIPFILYTGKRVYENMLVASLRTHTDQKLEYTLMADVEFREIVLVGTASGSSAISAAQLADPQSNMPETQRGPVYMREARALLDNWVNAGLDWSEVAVVETGEVAET